ncbi:hypothetical protein [Cyclobacterium marinum]|uniref:Uncharacterized protein n=1 Tax=Cyclobacterium marinum (strain ATCC 25205 / DSM 745 / LMG 13164 / NCIMB 1802) TaxID=880070 RepID=G0J3B4_CYCMS|nr:hypothetical protein [Cyclobacterium marinum]AEL24055.1 hypothetical protein Cycma_0274 [Cyclobacterium marinum DSM 745]
MYDANGFNIALVMIVAATITFLLIGYIIYKIASIKKVEEIIVSFSPTMSQTEKVELLYKERNEKIADLKTQFPTYKIHVLDTCFFGHSSSLPILPNFQIVSLIDATSAKIVFSISK